MGRKDRNRSIERQTFEKVKDTQSREKQVEQYFFYNLKELQIAPLTSFFFFLHIHSVLSGNLIEYQYKHKKLKTENTKHKNEI